MTSTQKTETAARDTIPPHLLSRIENEWQQMRSVATATPRSDTRPSARPASTARD